MSRNPDISRLRRLDELTTLLKSGSHRTARELAAALGVSLRTLTRDLQLLRERGLPVEAAVGRGGGVRLHYRWSIGRVTFDYREAIDALLSLAVAEKLGSTLFLKHLSSVRNKLAATFPESVRDRLSLLRRRILVAEPATATVLASVSGGAAAISAVREAFFEMRCMEILYRDAHGRETLRRVEAQFLCLSWPVWYVLAWDELRQDVRCFRIDRIQRVKVTAERFRLRPERLFLEALAHGARPL